MNLDLLESFGQSYPEDFDGSLDCMSIAVTCAFNKRGTLLAVGCNDGRIIVWDFLTRGVAKIINAHVHPVCCLSWNRNGRKLLSASTDNVVSMWDILTSECERTFRFPSPILKVQFNPRNSHQLLVCPMKHAAVLMQETGEHTIIPLDDESDVNVVAAFDRQGKFVYTGNARGRVMVYSTDSLKLRASFRITTGTSSTTAVKSIEFSRRGNCLLINSADRIIRVYEAGEVLACGRDGEPEPIQKLQDLVNKTLWKKCCFSGDGEYIVAGSARQHALYIWEQRIGNLVKILHGTKGEMLLDVVWHPVRPILASISSGVVSIWSQNQVENWSAFAPDFKELDENVEYEERESEFDIEDEDKEVEEAKGEKEGEDIEVDVTGVDPIAAFLSSDEEEEDTDTLVYLPVAPDFEETEQDWQGGEQGGDDDKKRKTSGGDSPKKKRQKTTVDVNLPGAPTDEIHPYFNVKKPADKQKGRGGGSSGVGGRSGKAGKGRVKDRSADYY